MTNHHKVNLTETKLEDMIRQTPGYIGLGLKYVARQHLTARGPLDLLLVDSGGALVIVELKVKKDDNMLTQAIDYYDDIVENIEGLARIYQDSNIDPTKAPRLILLAPSFSQTLLDRCKWIDIPLLLIEYQCIALVNNPEVPTLVTNEIVYPKRKKVLNIRTNQEHLEYITDDAARKSAKDLLDEVESWDKNNISFNSLTSQ